MKKRHKLLIGILLVEYSLIAVLNQLSIQINSKIGIMVGIVLLFAPILVLLYLLSRDFQISVKYRIMSRILFFFITICCLAGVIVRLLGLNN